MLPQSYPSQNPKPVFFPPNTSLAGEGDRRAPVDLCSPGPLRVGPSGTRRKGSGGDGGTLPLPAKVMTLTARQRPRVEGALWSW